MPDQSAKRAVFINRHALTPEQLAQLEGVFGVVIPAGRYWYDAVSGAWGLEGGPALGFGLPELDLPGPLPADISGGGTGIFVNGRELHIQEQVALQAIFGTTVPGRYTLDGFGSLSVEHGAFIANLRQAAAAQGGLSYGAGGMVAVDGEGAMFMSGPTGFFST